MSNGVKRLAKLKIHPVKSCSPSKIVPKAILPGQAGIPLKAELFNGVNWKKSNDLVPVIAQDFETGKVLMLGFMDRNALKKTLKEGKVTYFSRTRKKLWTKGETSGNLQLVKGIWLDCDDDSLLIKVKQIGNVCHTGHKTCFFRKFK